MKIYRHYKGSEYFIINEATHTETGEIMVVYQDVLTDRVWVRPSSMFFEKVLIESQLKDRFKGVAIYDLERTNKVIQKKLCQSTILSKKKLKCTIGIFLGERQVYIDYCLSGEVKELNQKGIKTVFSCCGHGEVGKAYIIVKSDYCDLMEEEEGYQLVDRFDSIVLGELCRFKVKSKLLFEK